MAFVQKEWKDRLVEFAGRRKLTNVATGEEIIVDVARNEGAVSQEGDAVNASNFNYLEQRVAEEFTKINSDLTQIKYIPNYSEAVSFDGFPYTAQSDGIVIVSFKGKSVDCSIYLTIGNVPVFNSFKWSSDGVTSGRIQVAKGDTLCVFNDGSDSRNYSIFKAFFIPYK